MSDMRDWLILNTKRSNDEMCWHAEGCCGYTLDLTRSGRFTEAEAKAEEARVPHYNLAVPLMVALSMARTWITVENGGGQMETLRRRMAKYERFGGSATEEAIALIREEDARRGRRRLLREIGRCPCPDCLGCLCAEPCVNGEPCRCDSPVVGKAPVGHNADSLTESSHDASRHGVANHDHQESPMHDGGDAVVTATATAESSSPTAAGDSGRVAGAGHQRDLRGPAGNGC